MKCQACKRRKAVWRIRNAFQSAANGKKVCDAAGCFSHFTLGYPAEGVRIG
ncbi:hypothetical protein SEA_FRANKLIN22_57 [Microbacterium phage Franklin22]|uniref:hypothetical protein n=1 Tax=Microbacterium phage Franklin22 TaxID=2894293 RepID=UPI001E7B4588|nr:hypothetical protein QDW15_gp57 [Microbacterium phage Franklin22]UGL61870.1 hypothetical protein SEA_FRANKLIN22_57 [Microbacterium phage Franklin22]